MEMHIKNIDGGLPESRPPIVSTQC